MIAAHRGRHRLIWIVLAVALPTLVVLALTARPDRPVNPSLPEGVESFADEGAQGAP